MIKNINEKKVLLIVTGGIASYKSLELIRSLKKSKLKLSLECVLTKSVKNFINPLSFSSLLGKKVHQDLFSLGENSKMSHIKLAQEPDLIIIAPITANFIGKISNGMADDLASNIILATEKPVFIAPAMNTGMWKNVAVKNNLKKLKTRGFKVLEPGSGELACGQLGKGKMIPPEKICTQIIKFFKKELILNGKKAIVTSGPSIEKIDPVRFISNFSSGLQGYEIANALSIYGADTTLITGPTNLEIPKGIKVKKVTSAKDFLKNSIESLPADIFISVAAISDWSVENFKNKKIKKTNNPSPELKLVQNKDVLKEVCLSHKRPQLVIGFAAETENLIPNAKKKLKEKKCDWILANLVSDKVGFNSKLNKVSLLSSNQTIKWPTSEKKVIAEKLVLHIGKYFDKLS